MTFHTAMRLRRINSPFSQDQLARILGVRSDTVYRWESGRSNKLAGEHVLRMLVLYGIDPKSLLKDIESNSDGASEDSPGPAPIKEIERLAQRVRAYVRAMKD